MDWLSGGKAADTNKTHHKNQNVFLYRKKKFLFMKMRNTQWMINQTEWSELIYSEEKNKAGLFNLKSGEAIIEDRFS